MASTESTRTQSSDVLFHREYVFRSSNGVLAILVLALFGILFLWAANQGANINLGKIGRFVSVGFAVAGVILIGLGAQAVVSFVIDKRIVVSISGDGIRRGQGFTPWSDIAVFYGTRYTNGISLGFSPRGKRIYIEKSLSTTPLLTDKEYKELANTLHGRLVHERSDVQIELFPREPIGD